MGRSYPADIRIRAVALAEATSLEDASRKLGIGKDTIARWIDEAPDASALERAHDLAMSEMTAKMASGETRGIRDLAVVAGIMRDKMARYGRAKSTGEPPAASVFEQLEDWVMADVIDPDELVDDAAFEAHHEAIEDLHSELLSRANEEPHQPHRPPFLAVRRESVIPARPPLEASPDLLPWMQAHVAQIVLEHGGSLVPAVAAVTQARAESYRVDSAKVAERATRVRYLIESGVPVADAIAQARNPPELDPETLALIERAEQFLQEIP